MAESNLNESDTKLIQWLLEAHAKEAELEADLVAHISLTKKDAYRKRLQAHLKETRDHKKRVEQRIRQLGGDSRGTGTGVNLPGVPGMPGAVGELAGKALAGVKGQLGLARAAVTEQNETHLRNAQEEFREEHVEIALYTSLEALAAEVGDRDTAKLAASIRRDEERMAKYLEAEIKRLVKDVVRAEIPRDQRAGTTGRRRAGTARRSSTGRSRSTTAATKRSRSSSSGQASRSRSSSSGSTRARRPAASARSSS